MSKEKDIKNNELEENEEIEEELTEVEEEINLDEDETVAALEALLFSTGASMDINALAGYMNKTPEEVTKAADTLTNRYKNKRCGLELLRLENSLQLCTKKSCYPVMRKLLGAPKRATLSETVLETLAIVAYKQPVTRVEIESIRGVSCGHQINKLLEYDLIKELGRLDVPGKPLLFGTTEQFLKSFAVSSIDELPVASPMEIEDFRAQAEAEIEEVRV